VPNRIVKRPAGSVTDRHSHAADHPARPPLAHLVRLPQMGDGLSLDSGRHHFFDSRSFNAALSSIESANSFFNRAFSPSTRLRLTAWLSQHRRHPPRAEERPGREQLVDPPYQRRIAIIIGGGRRRSIDALRRLMVQ